MDLAIKPVFVVSDERAPVSNRGLESRTFWSILAINRADVVKGDVIRSDHAGPGTAFDRHIADRHPAFHGEGTNSRPIIFDDVAGASAGADLADDGQNDVFGFQARGEHAGHFDAETFRLTALPKCLGGQNVLDFAGADPEGQSTESAVGGCVAVAADHGEAGQCEAKFRADHVDDPLTAGADIEQGDSKFFAIITKRIDLAL